MKGSELFDKEKVSFNLARYSHGGEKFEVVVDPDKVIAFKNGTLKDVKEALTSEKVFSDAKKGMIAPDSSLTRSFETTDPLKVAEIILMKGKVQLTSEYRDNLRDIKKRQIIDLIHRNSIDPRTSAPHPVQRIENAFTQAKVKIDEHKNAEDQLDEIRKKLQPIMPIRFETRKLQLTIPSTYASQAFPSLKKYGRISKDSWQSDGSLLTVVEIPAGLQEEMMEHLNKLTHGDVEMKVLD